MSRPWCAACAFLRDPASRKVACQARDPARARGDLPCPRPDADEPALPGAMFSSFSRLPYVGEPPRALRAAYFSLLAIGGTCQHLNRYFPGSKPHTVSKTVDLTFSIVLAPIIVMLPCTLTKLFQLLPKEKGYTFLGLFFGVALAAPPLLLPSLGIPKDTPIPTSLQGYTTFVAKHKHGDLPLPLSLASLFRGSDAFATISPVCVGAGRRGACTLNGGVLRHLLTLVRLQCTPKPS